MSGHPCHLLFFQVMYLQSGRLPAGGLGQGRRRKEGSPLLVHPPAELSSTAGSQSQGEGRGSSLSIHSLPSGPSSPFSTEEQPVASWALSFERLLQDPLGVAYFTVSLGLGQNGGRAEGRRPCRDGEGAVERI